MTVVYLDRVAVLNLLVDYLLLLATATLAGTPLRRLRFGVCAALGALYAVLVFICRSLAHPLYRAAVGVVLARWAFHREVRPWRLTALFWLLSAGLAGLLLALGLLAGSPTGVFDMDGGFHAVQLHLGHKPVGAGEKPGRDAVGIGHGDCLLWKMGGKMPKGMVH